VLVEGGTEVGLVVVSSFGGVLVWYQRVCEVLHHPEGIVVAGARVGVVIAVDAAAVVVQLRRRMEQGHCVGEGNLEARLAVVGIEVLPSG
jgi:hypothetical protein